MTMAVQSAVLSVSLDRPSNLLRSFQKRYRDEAALMSPIPMIQKASL